MQNAVLTISLASTLVPTILRRISSSCCITMSCKQTLKNITESDYAVRKCGPTEFNKRLTQCMMFGAGGGGGGEGGKDAGNSGN